jgi:hypothetical protein
MHSISGGARSNPPKGIIFSLMSDIGMDSDIDIRTFPIPDDSFQSDIFVSDIRITDVNVGYCRH